MEEDEPESDTILEAASSRTSATGSGAGGTGGDESNGGGCICHRVVPRRKSKCRVSEVAAVEAAPVSLFAISLQEPSTLSEGKMEWIGVGGRVFFPRFRSTYGGGDGDAPATARGGSSLTLLSPFGPPAAMH